MSTQSHCWVWIQQWLHTTKLWTLLFFAISGLSDLRVALTNTKLRGMRAIAQPIQKPPIQHPDYKAVLPTLRQQVKIPVLLPTEIPSELPIYANLDSAQPTSYRLTLDFTPTCHGAAVCTLGRISGEAIPAPIRRPIGKVVLLDGTKGYFSKTSPENCNVGYCFMGLTWDWQGYRYQLLLKSADLKIFQQVANSTLPNQSRRNLP